MVENSEYGEIVIRIITIIKKKDQVSEIFQKKKEKIVQKERITNTHRKGLGKFQKALHIKREEASKMILRLDQKCSE